VKFIVHGPPVAWQRARSNGRRRYTDPRVAAHKAAVALAARAAGVTPLDGPVGVTVAVVLARPQRLLAKRCPDAPIPAPVRPDVDNYAKAVLDALNGIAYADDGQVTTLNVTKWYAERGGEPRTEVTLWQG
jgi:Holliday junction resolvase RusA-like endonuclease